MKDISLRPKPHLMNLFEVVQNLDNLPSINRNSIIDRALDVALKSSHVNWQAVSEVSIENKFNHQVPTHVVLKVDEEKFSQIKGQIKEAFHVEKVTIPYTLKLLLTLYFIHLKQQADTANQKERMHEILTPDGEIHTWVLKNEYEQSLYSGKRRLFDICKVFLKHHPTINEQLIEQGSRELKAYRELIDLNKYFAHMDRESSPTSTYTTKVLAGLFILRIESVFEQAESKNKLDHLVKQLEIEFQIIGEANTQAESTDYYKHVYAKMMGGKV